MLNKTLITATLIVISLNFIACQKKEPESVAVAPKDSTVVEKNPSDQQSKQEIPAVWAKPYRMAVVNQELCHPESEEEVAACTIYDLQSIKTNIDWINQYYDNDIKKNYPKAFAAKSNVVLEGEDADRKYYEGVMVSFVGQRYNLVTFNHFINAYSGGAHNIYHLQYDVFDLKTKKKINLDDILKSNAKAKLLTLVKSQNADKLKEYNTDLNDLKLSENFYFGENGIVFMYSLYEIAPFVVGMPELSVDYDALTGLIKDEYLPEQPDMSLSQEFS